MSRRTMGTMHSDRLIKSVKPRLSFFYLGISKLLVLLVPPIFQKIYILLKNFTLEPLPKLGDEFKNLSFAHHALQKLVSDFDFLTVLDVGSGSGEHAKVLKKNGKKVTAIDFGTSIYAMQADDNYDDIRRICIDFHAYKPGIKFDCVWASHVLEHQADPGAFIRKCIELTNDNGVLAITVPPLEHSIVGGHLTVWNAGLLLYQLVFNGLDCREASICTYGYNVSIIVVKNMRPAVELAYDSGDIRALKMYFPKFVDEPFDGRIRRWNW